jgi:hypothetical protein
MEEERRRNLNRPPADQPWMTKGMVSRLLLYIVDEGTWHCIQMRPTGFEEFFADAPVTPAAFEEEQSIYDRYVSSGQQI